MSYLIKTSLRENGIYNLFLNKNPLKTVVNDIFELIVTIIRKLYISHNVLYHTFFLLSNKFELKIFSGSDDIRATDPIHTRPRGIFRPISEIPEWPFSKSIYDDPVAAGERIQVPGYRYDPLHRDTYGYSPRKIFPHNYGSLDRYRPGKSKLN